MDTEELRKRQDSEFSALNEVYYFGLRLLTFGMRLEELRPKTLRFNFRFFLMFTLQGILAWYCGYLFYTLAVEQMDAKTYAYTAYIAIQMTIVGHVKFIINFFLIDDLLSVMIKSKEFHSTLHRPQNALNELNRKSFIARACLFVYQMSMLITMFVYIIEPFTRFLIELLESKSLQDLTTSDLMDVVFFLLVALACLIATADTVAVNCFFGLVGSLIYAQFNILNESIVNYTHSKLPIWEADDKFLKGGEYLYIDDKKEPINLEKFMEDHKRLIDICQKLNDVMSPYVSIQLLASVLSFTLMAFFLVSESESQTELVEPAGEIVIATLELVIYCIIGSLIKQATDSVSFAVYCSDWYVEPVRYKAPSQMIMLSCQKPISLTAFKVVNIDLPTIIDMFNLSYSYYTVLRELNK